MSNKSFGLQFAVIFLLFGGFSIAFGSSFVVFGFLLAGVLAALVGLFRPGALERPKIQWLRFSGFLGKWINPVLTAVLYFSLVTFFGVARRIRTDALSLELGKGSTWVHRDDGLLSSQKIYLQY